MVLLSGTPIFITSSVDDSLCTRKILICKINFEWLSVVAAELIDIRDRLFNLYRINSATLIYKETIRCSWSAASSSASKISKSRYLPIVCSARCVGRNTPLFSTDLHCRRVWINTSGFGFRCIELTNQMTKYSILYHQTEWWSCADGRCTLFVCQLASG